MKAYKYKLHASPAVERKFEAAPALCCELYNAALQERRDAYHLAGESISYLEQANQLPEIKRERSDLFAVHSQVLQETLERLQFAFDNFFRRLREGQSPGYPRFRSRSRYDSFTCPQSGWRLEKRKLHLSKIGSCRVHLSRPIEGTIETCTIKREADGWFVVFAVEENQSPYIPRTGERVGIEGLMKNHHLAKAISDAAWGTFLLIHTAKAAEAPACGGESSGSVHSTGLQSLWRTSAQVPLSARASVRGLWICGTSGSQRCAQ